MSLQQGSQGKAVGDLQAALQRRGATITDRPGIFGPSTAAAVVNFQSRHGLAPDSVVGQATWQALGLRGSVPRPVRID
jgi:peptidoglycan hydrolase-like protein with peptidoglycan-binding domain